MEQVRKWEDMNEDCLSNIFSRIGSESMILHIPLVCKSWYKLTLDPRCWKCLDFQSSKSWYKVTLDPKFWKILDSDSHNHTHGFAKLKLELAINRSRGTATKLVLPVDFLEALLVETYRYGPKSLTLEPSSGHYFLNLFFKLRDLEILEFRGDNFYLNDILRGISCNCNKFTALTVRTKFKKTQALAISGLLPKIKYLNLSGSVISRKNVMRILSGCKNLVSLDVSYCKGFDVKDQEIVDMVSSIKTFVSNHTSSFYEFSDDSDDDDDDDDDDQQYAEYENGEGEGSESEDNMDV